MEECRKQFEEWKEENWMYVEVESDAYEIWKAAWNRRAEDVPEGWKEVAVELPKDGQRIIGCSKDFDTWYEVWDSEEPIGATRWWIAAPEVKQ